MVDTPAVATRGASRTQFTYNGKQYTVDSDTKTVWRLDGNRWVVAENDPDLRRVADQSLAGGGNAQIPPYVPGGGATPTYPRGVTNPGATPPAASTTPAAPPAPPATPAPGAPAAAPPSGGYPPVGTMDYDRWVVNDMLRNAGYDGWQMLGDTPVEITTPDSIDPDAPPVKTGVYIVNVRNPATNEIKQIKMTRAYVDAEGKATTSTNPKDPYSWQLQSVADQQRADPNKKGYDGTVTIGTTLYGTNQTTGAFEPVAGAPQIPVGWGTPYQVDDNQGHLVWYGIDPKTKNPAPIPGMPGTNKPTPGPGSIAASGGMVYVKNEDGSYTAARGIPDPNPPIGTPRITLGPDGFLIQSTHKGNGQWDLDPTFAPVPFTQAAQAASQGQHKIGERQPRVFGGKVYEEYWDGSEWRVDPNVPAKPMPGAGTPTTVSSPAGDEFITQRSGDTGAIESIRNPNWAPTDPAARTRQLSTMANAKLGELQAKIGKNGYTEAQAQAEMDAWWDTNVEPAKQQLAVDQQRLQNDEQLRIGAEARARTAQQASNYTTAQTAGQNAVENYKAQQQNMVGPNWGSDYFEPLIKAIGSGGPVPNIPASAFQYQGYDYNQLAQYATAQALAHISPTAAGIVGGPGSLPSLPQAAAGVDYNQALNRTNYRPSGGGITINIGGDTSGAAPAPPPGPGTSYGPGTMAAGPLGAGVGAAIPGIAATPIGAFGAGVGQYVPR